MFLLSGPAGPISRSGENFLLPPELPWLWVASFRSVVVSHGFRRLPVSCERTAVGTWDHIQAIANTSMEDSSYVLTEHPDVASMDWGFSLIRRGRKTGC